MTKMTSPSGIEKKGFQLAEKVEIINKLDNGASVAAVAKEHGRPPQSVYAVRQPAKILKDLASGDCRGKSETATKSNWPELDNLLADWFKRARAAGIAMSDLSIEQKASEIEKTLNIVVFSCCHGYVCRFKKRELAVDPYANR